MANTAQATVDFICPTFNNDVTIKSFVYSLVRNTMEPFRLIIVNNGDRDIFKSIPPNDHRIIALKTDKNLGWMGGINGGLEWARANNPAKYFCFINDDVQIIDHDYGWMTKMLLSFGKENLGAVGPVSNNVMGYQSNNHIGLPPYIETARLSGMCMLVRSDVVDKVGVLDESLPGGDDLDYSIRIRKAGYRLGICRRSFILHHYATTGKRVHGEYWDSTEHTEAINNAIIHKHGFKAWLGTIMDNLPGDSGYNFVAGEEELVLKELGESLENGVVLDVGCGGKKIHPKAVGVDIRSSGKLGVGYNATVASAADVDCDASNLDRFKDGSVDTILVKHLLEHILDLPKAINEWRRVLKDSGKLIIVVPDWRYCEAISCDPSHVHAFTPESLSSIIESVGGFKITNTENVTPGYQIVMSCEKIPVTSMAVA